MQALRLPRPQLRWIVAAAAAAGLGSCGESSGGGGGGAVATECPSGQLLCDGRCISVIFDRYNCGNCGVECPADLVCSLSECTDECTGGTTECGGECVDLDTDLLHCGSCNNACRSGEVCNGEGACRPSCVPPLLACDGRCVDVSRNSSHCGGCGQICSGGAVCDGRGQCAATCAPGFVVCDGICVDPMVSSAHCGASGDCQGESAGTACLVTEACEAGSCHALPCEDLWELTAHTNDTENNATQLATAPVGDCAAEQPQSGLIDGADDVDWYTYEGEDGSCIVNPEQSLGHAEPPLRLCVFLECVDPLATTFFTCPDGTEAAASPDGRSGCCLTGSEISFEVGDLDCTDSMDDSAFVYLRVDDPAATPSTCSSYTLRYHY